MERTAHRFSVLLPVTTVTEDPFEMERRLQLARRIVELEKPAHTVFDVRFYWALNRIGEARLGIDTLLDVGSRAPQLLPDAVLGRAYVGRKLRRRREGRRPIATAGCSHAEVDHVPMLTFSGSASWAAVTNLRSTLTPSAQILRCM